MPGTTKTGQSCLTYPCFVDSENAYDWVPRCILLEVLWKYGATGLIMDKAVWQVVGWVAVYAGLLPFWQRLSLAF